MSLVEQKAFRWALVMAMVWGVSASASEVGSDSSNASKPLVSMRDKEFIAAQFLKCWNSVSVANDPGSSIVTMRVMLNTNGSVATADLLDDAHRYSSDSQYRAAADRAHFAVNSCSPIKLPPGQYDALKEIVLTFDPRNSLR